MGGLVKMRKTQAGGALEVDKDALGSLRAQKPCEVTLGPDGCPEHEIEVEGRRDVILGLRRLHFVRCECCAQLGRVQLVYPSEQALHLLYDYSKPSMSTDDREI